LRLSLSLRSGMGHSDAARALQLAAEIGQPGGAVIYFAVDHDYVDPGHIATIRSYFSAIHHDFAGQFRVGVYGSGLVGRTVQDAGYASHIWLAAASGWSGTKDLLKTEKWALLQKWPPVAAPVSHDGNVVSAAWPDFGQFVPGQDSVLANVGATPALMEVIASGGLNLRRGPGESFPVERSLPYGSLVHGLHTEDKWVLVDTNGDGSADGYMYGGFLAAVSGGFPAPAAISAASLSPYDIAKAELALGVAEFPGSANNPRIVMYHQSTNMNAGTADSVPWCSAFVNYAVEAAGMIGTNSQWALSWADWGVAATSPKEGDIVVFERIGAGGHVGFLCRDLGDQIEVRASQAFSSLFEGVVQRLHGQFHVLAVDQHRDLDLAGGDDLDVDPLGRQRPQTSWRQRRHGCACRCPRPRPWPHRCRRSARHSGSRHGRCASSIAFFARDLVDRQEKVMSVTAPLGARHSPFR
jgi:uncharacterized protein (TIGR02594 family)